MPSTYLSLHYHLIFGTKNHDAAIHSHWRRRLHAQLGGIVKTLNGVPESIGGASDHVHMLVGLRATHTLADVLRDVKSVSSGWVHDEIKLHSFAWQEGYAAFTVSASQLQKVCAYIENQEEHHRTHTFRDEYIALLERHGIKFDERYLL